MPDQTPNLQLPLPLGNENVNRQFFIDLITAIDSGAVSETQLEEALSQVAIALTQNYNSTDPDVAISGDAVRRGLETKQNILRLADNYLAASVLVNAAADTNGRAYPDGVSMFKVSSSAGGWPAANGYVLTFRAGSGGYQIFYEMYTGTTQTDKTARQWTRSKRDNNAFWQDWARGLTEADINNAINSTNTTQVASADALRRVAESVIPKMDADRPSNLIPNGSAIAGFSGWKVMAGVGWEAARNSDTSPSYFVYTPATASGVVPYLESELIPVTAGNVYNLSAEFFTSGYAAGTAFVHLSTNTGVNLPFVNSTLNDAFTGRRNADFTIPAGATSVVVRIAISESKPSGTKAIRKVQLTLGPGLKPWNNDADGIALFQSVVNGKASVKTAVIGKGGTVSQAGSVPTFTELVAGVNSIGTGGIVRSNGDITQEGLFNLASFPAGIKNSISGASKPNGLLSTRSDVVSMWITDGITRIMILSQGAVGTQPIVVTSVLIDVANRISTVAVTETGRNINYAVLSGFNTALTGLDFNRPITIQFQMHGILRAYWDAVYTYS